MMEKGQTGKRASQSARTLEKKIESYFAACEDRGELPSIAGLALALGYPGRRNLEEALKEEGQSKKAVYLIRAKARIEEANVQAVYRRETSAGAKVILQTEFGYADKEKIDPARLIEVKLVP